MQDLPQPLAEPHEERPIQTQRGTDALDIGGRGLIAGDDRGGIAGREIQQAEHEERDDEHHRDGGQDAPRGVGKHAVAAGSACGPAARTRRIVTTEYADPENSKPMHCLLEPPPCHSSRLHAGPSPDGS